MSPGARWLLAAAVLVAAVGLAVLIGAGFFEPPVAPGPPGASQTRPEGQAAAVVRVADGDTITVELEGRRERVRYIGIDAPEVADERAGTPAECGGDAARIANAELVGGEIIVLERDESDRDRFGRLLRHAWVAGDDGWSLVGEHLVAIGAAEARSYPPDTARDAQLDAAERAARDGGLGIWTSC